MIKFGPSGSDELFFEEGHKATLDMPDWVADKGLDVFEYSFGRGVNISQATAHAIGERAKARGVEISVHAPYFINLASEEPDKIRNSYRFLSESIRALSWFGGNRCIFHPGSTMKQERQVALNTLYDNLATFMDIVNAEEGLDCYLCPETMGKINQIGDVAEIALLCSLDERLLPCVDFGHLNARTNGGLKTVEDYAAVIDLLENKLGHERTSAMHVHFSHIEYTAKGGEVRHLTFEDNVYGPFFAPLARVIADRKLSPVIICESAGTQLRDALTMKNIYKDISETK